MVAVVAKYAALPDPCRTCSNTSATSATSQFFSHQPIRTGHDPLIATHSFPFFWPFNVKCILRALTLAHLHTCGHLQKMLITSFQTCVGPMLLNESQRTCGKTTRFNIPQSSKWNTRSTGRLKQKCLRKFYLILASLPCKL